MHLKWKKKKQWRNAFINVNHININGTHLVLNMFFFQFLNICFKFSSVCRVQIMLLTDPEVESSLLISSDEGATFQKYRLNFYILSLLFHPEQEDWILAYSHDQKVSEQARLLV